MKGSLKQLNKFLTVLLHAVIRRGRLKIFYESYSYLLPSICISPLSKAKRTLFSDFTHPCKPHYSLLDQRANNLFENLKTPLPENEAPMHHRVKTPLISIAQPPENFCKFTQVFQRLQELHLKKTVTQKCLENLHCTYLSFVNES